MKRVDDAIQRLFEDPGLREDLVDDDAMALMRWAQTKLAELDSTGEDDAQFEAHVDTVKQMVKEVNRLVGKGKADALQAIVQHATALGQPIVMEAAAQVASQPTVQSVLSMFSQAASAPAEAPRMSRQEAVPEQAEHTDSPFQFLFGGGKKETPAQTAEEPTQTAQGPATPKTEPESSASAWGKTVEEREAEDSEPTKRGLFGLTVEPDEPESGAGAWSKAAPTTEPESSASLWGKAAKDKDEEVDDDDAAKDDKPPAKFLGWSGRTSDDSTPDSGDRA